MARPRSFDADVVVTVAAGVFRRLGYEAASVDALVAATGLHRGSLYGAFGSKRGLFVAALRDVVTNRRTDDDALDLALVAALELAPRDTEVRELLAAACEGIDDLAGGRAGALGARLLDRAGLDDAGLDRTDTPRPTSSGRSTRWHA